VFSETVVCSQVSKSRPGAPGIETLGAHEFGS
jgi:hypothetical protein